MRKPYSESCEQNKDVILSVIQPYLSEGTRVLEIGSGTGQHAVYFSGLNPQIVWQPSDRAEYLPGITAWVADAACSNLATTIELDVLQQWPNECYDLVFTANSFHIMSQKAVELCLKNVPKCLINKGYFIIYGPFNYNQQYTSTSNQRFDEYLKTNNPDSGIKDFEWISDIAQGVGLDLVDDIEMPANNRILIWQQETLVK